MRTRSIGFAAIAALAAVAFTIPTLTARQRSTTKWEYVRLTPGLRFGMDYDMSQRPMGYQACEARDAAWKCRDFKSADQQSNDDALRRALATLGAEGWELVSTIDQSGNIVYPVGLTYLLKRSSPCPRRSSRICQRAGP